MIDLDKLKADLPDNYNVEKKTTTTIRYNYLNTDYCFIQYGECSIIIDNLTSVCGGCFLSYFETGYSNSKSQNFLKNVVAALQEQGIGYIQYIVAEYQDWEDEIVEALNKTGFTGHNIGYNPKTDHALTLFHIVCDD